MLTLFMLVLVVMACSRSDSAERVGGQFVQAYYVQIDQARALEFTTGLARERLQEELRQVTHLRRSSNLEQARPQVSYVLARTQREGRQVLLIYDLTVTPSQVAPILKKILIITEQQGEGWKVINFTETDARP